MSTSTEITLLVLFFAGAVGGVAGYLLRIVQKLEDKRDNVYLKVLPSIYALVYTLIDAKSNLLNTEPEKSGKAFGEFLEKIKGVGNDLKLIVFSGEVLLMHDKTQKELFHLYEGINALNQILDQMTKDTTNLKLFQMALKEGKSFLDVNLKDLWDEADATNALIQSKLKTYKSFSYLLVILIFILTGIVAVTGYFLK